MKGEGGTSPASFDHQSFIANGLASAASAFRMPPPTLSLRHARVNTGLGMNAAFASAV
jgi:hypothetical protein